jgi:GNAT superfamily N-acetyltransferase
VNVTIRHAQTADDLDGIFLARHRVFVDSDGYLPATADRRISDRFDAYPTTRNVLAEHDCHVVGGARFTLSSAVGTPPDEFFDFSPFLAERGTVYAAGSMLFLEPGYRGTKITSHMLALGYAWAAAAGATQIIGVVNDKIVGSFVNSGFRQLSGPLVDLRKGLPFVPVLLDLRDLDPAMSEAMRSTYEPLTVDNDPGR